MNPVIPINALFDDGCKPNPEGMGWGQIADADLILGVDVMTEREILIYGKTMLETISSSGETQAVNVVRVGIDEETEELEKLIALVQTVKGSHDYSGGGE